MQAELEEAFGNWIDGTAYDQAEAALFQVIRQAFLAGWEAGRATDPAHLPATPRSQDGAAVSSRP